MKVKSFFFHYNKPASKKAGFPKMSIHHDKTCHIVDHVQCHVSCATNHRKRQPHCVMKGYCTSVRIFESADSKLYGQIN